MGQPPTLPERLYFQASQFPLHLCVCVCGGGPGAVSSVVNFIYVLYQCILIKKILIYKINIKSPPFPFLLLPSHLHFSEEIINIWRTSFQIFFYCEFTSICTCKYIYKCVYNTNTYMFICAHINIYIQTYT